MVKPRSVSSLIKAAFSHEFDEAWEDITTGGGKLFKGILKMVYVIQTHMGEEKVVVIEPPEAPQEATESPESPGDEF